MGNQESPMNYQDNIYPFRQDSNFLYFLGIDKPDLAAVIDIDAGETTLYGDDLTIDSIIWMGPHTSMKELAARSGVKKNGAYSELEGTLKKALKEKRKIHFLPPYRAENKFLFSEWLGIPYQKLKEEASVDLIKAVVKQAVNKSAEEVAEIEKAVNVTGILHTSIMKAAKAGMKETELVGLVEGIARSSDGRLSYPAIVSINGQTLHNHYYGNTLKEGQLLLADVGFETSMHYAGDITRTTPVSKTFTQKQKDIYNIVLEAEVKAIGALKPGTPYKEIHLLAAIIVMEGLKSLGLMKGNTEEAVAQGAHALFFPHGLGHMMGLDVHDMEDLGEHYVGYNDEIERSTQFGLAYLRLGRPLQPGFVLTVEPGIYFIPELIDLWKSEGKFTDFINYEKVESYKDFGGIRIEDNVLITEDSYRILGDPIPKTVEEVEALR